jgi:hypothetical protein
VAALALLGHVLCGAMFLGLVLLHVGSRRRLPWDVWLLPCGATALCLLVVSTGFLRRPQFPTSAVEAIVCLAAIRRGGRTLRGALVDQGRSSTRDDTVP